MIQPEGFCAQRTAGQTVSMAHEPEAADPARGSDTEPHNPA